MHCWTRFQRFWSIHWLVYGYNQETQSTHSRFGNLQTVNYRWGISCRTAANIAPPQFWTGVHSTWFSFQCFIIAARQRFALKVYLHYTGHELWIRLMGNLYIASNVNNEVRNLKFEFVWNSSNIQMDTTCYKFSTKVNFQWQSFEIVTACSYDYMTNLFELPLLLTHSLKFPCPEL